MRKIASLVFLLACFNAKAQETGQLSGTIADGRGLPIEHALVELKSANRQTFTNASGYFQIKSLPAGDYDLQVRHNGYVPLLQQIKIISGRTTELSLTSVENPIQLEQLVVTAEKRSDLLQNVPMAISALSARQIDDRKIREMGDLVLSVPNLITMTIGAPTLSIMSMRGVLTFSTDPVVGIYIDGIPMFDGYSSSMHLQNIQRVEVLRGPQSTLYGRNGLGGVINITTRSPGNRTTGHVEAGLGNYGSQRYNFAVSGPLVKNKLFAGISGVYDTRNGFFTNDYNNKKFDKPQTYNGNFYLKYLASDKLSFTLNAKGEYNHIKGTFPYTMGPDESLNNPFRLNQDGTNIEKRTLFSSSLQALYQLGGIQLSSITGYTYLNDLYRDYDVDYSPYNAILFEIPRQPQGTFTQEFKIVTDESKRLKFTGGVFGFADRKQADTQYIYGPDAASFDPNAPYSSTVFSDRKIFGMAGYAHLTYSFDQRWAVTAGLRFDYEKRRLIHSTDFTKAPDPPVVIAPETELKGNNSAFSPKLGLSYKPSESSLLYANYARGYRAGGFNPYSVENTHLNYDPEYTNNFEVGYKSEWFSSRLRANIALFYTHWKDQQQTLSLPQNRTDNVGEMTSTGGELELLAVLTKGLEVSYQLGIVSTDFKKLLLPDETGSENRNYVGNKQVFTPAYSSALSLTYRVPVGKKANAFVVPEWKQFGKQYMTYYNDLTQDPFGLLNATAGVAFKHLELSIWGKNLSDSRYLSFAYATQRGAMSPVLIGNPLTYGAAVKVKF